MSVACCSSLAVAAVRTLVLVLAVLGARPLLAQNRRFDFTLTGGPLAFAAPTAADFAAGFALHPTGLTFEVDVANNAHPNTLFETTISLRATTPVLGGSGKPISDLEWSLGGAGGPWTPLSLVDAAVETRTVRRNRQNDPWLNTLHFRMLLEWATDTPATYTTGIVVTLTVTGS
jgi:hypothetical protein